MFRRIALFRLLRSFGCQRRLFLVVSSSILGTSFLDTLLEPDRCDTPGFVLRRILAIRLVIVKLQILIQRVNQLLLRCRRLKLVRQLELA